MKESGPQTLEKDSTKKSGLRGLMQRTRTFLSAPPSSRDMSLTQKGVDYYITDDTEDRNDVFGPADETDDPFREIPDEKPLAKLLPFERPQNKQRQSSAANTVPVIQNNAIYYVRKK